MLSRTVIGNWFPGVVRYQSTGRLDDPQDKRPELLLASGVRTGSAEQTIEDFTRRCRQNSHLKSPVWHSTLSFHPNDAARLDSAQMLEITRTWMKEMNLDKTQFIVVRHHDREDNQHVHVVANRVRADGSTVRDGQNFLRSRDANQAVEKQFGLTPGGGSSNPELQHPERIAGPDRARAEIRQAIGRLLAAGVTERAELLNGLQAQAITPHEFRDARGQVKGISFEKDGHYFKGREVARDYSSPGLDRLLARSQEQAAQQAEATRHVEAEQRANRREAIRLMTQADVLQVRDSGLSSPAQFLYRLSRRGYGFNTDAATGQATHVRHLASGETYFWAEVLPPGSPPLAEQLATASGVEQQRLTAQRAQAEASTWAQARTQAEQSLTEMAATGRCTTRERLAKLADAAGYPLLPLSAPGETERFKSKETGEIFREREVLRGGTVAALVTEAQAARTALRRELKPEITAVLEQTKYPADAPLKNLKDYQARLAAQGLQLQESSPGKGIDLVRHQASGQAFYLRDVQPGGPAAPALSQQVRAVIAEQQAGQAQAEQQLAGVLARKEFTSWPEFYDQAQQRGYSQVFGLDGQPRLLHEASRQHFALADLQPNGRDLVQQVTEGIATRAAEIVHGRIEVGDRPERSAAERVVLMQTRLAEAGVQAEVVEVPAPGTRGTAWLAYQYRPGGNQQDAVNETLTMLQGAPHTRVLERPGALLGADNEWGPRRGQPGEATLLVAASATQTAPVRATQLTRQLEAAGALVLPGQPEGQAGGVTLRVRYHTAHAQQAKLTQLLDHYKHDTPGTSLRETEAGQLARGGREQVNPKIQQITR